MVQPILAVSDEDKAAWQAFMEQCRHAAFVLPRVHAEKAMERFAAAGVVTKPGICRYGQFDFACLVVARYGSGEHVDVKAEGLAYPSGTKTKAGSCSVDGLQDVFLQLILPVQARVTFDALFKGPEGVVVGAIVEVGYRGVLEELSRITGREVLFEERHQSTPVSPAQPEPGTIHILSGRCPTGLTRVKNVTHLYGISLFGSRAGSMPIYRATRARGTVLRDGAGTETAQIVGDLWFLLYPSVIYHHSSESTDLFSRVIGHLLSAWEQPPPAPEEKPASEDALTEAYVGFFDRMADLYEDRVAELEKDIVEAERRLVSLIRARDDMHANAVAVCESDVREERATRAANDMRAILTLPLVASAHMAEGLLVVKTKPIAVTHDGKTYDLGPFCIGIDEDSVHGIWTESPTHHDGVEHPHIGNGTACMGNATLAVAKAFAELRHADAIRHILRWLAEGYTPALTERKIEEWPLVGESPDGYARRLGIITDIEDPHQPSPQLVPCNTIDRLKWEAARAAAQSAEQAPAAETEAAHVAS